MSRSGILYITFKSHEEQSKLQEIAEADFFISHNTIQSTRIVDVNDEQNTITVECLLELDMDHDEIEFMVVPFMEYSFNDGVNHEYNMEQTDISFESP